MSNLIAFIQRAARGKAVIGFFIPAMTVYALMLLVAIPMVGQHAPGMELFDLSPTGYSHLYAMTLLNALGDEGRYTYLYRQLPLDFIFPGLFAISCSLMLSWLFAKCFRPESAVFYLCLVPVAAGLFDYLENIGIVRMLLTYPHVTELNVSLASTMTILKSGLTTAFFLSLAAGIYMAWKSGRHTKATDGAS